MSVQQDLRSHRRLFLRMSACLLCTTSLFAAADYTRDTVPHHPKKAQPARPAATARVALFERDDLPRATKLAQLELARAPHTIEPWFLAMEIAHASADARTELKSATEICRLAKDADPRGLIAAMRLEATGQNSEVFRDHRSQIEAVAAKDSVCSAAAIEALYTAGLQGLPNTDLRALALASGWITNWSIARVNGGSASERFEFPDARVRVPDYLPRNAKYVAQAEYLATESGTFTITGDLNATQITMDDKGVTGAVALESGVHQLRITFRPGDVTPRIRIAKSLTFDPATVATLHLPPHESAYIEAAALAATGDLASAAAKLNTADLAATQIGHLLLATRKPAAPSDPLDHARWLAGNNRYLEALDELNEYVREWPLDRDARRLLISELQRLGNNTSADRAAAEFLAVAPNARNYRRMAQNATSVDGLVPDPPFFAAYRRPAPAPLQTAGAPAVVLLQDKVAISRPDGSVSLYMHRVVQLMNDEGIQTFQTLPLPEGAQLLTSRIVNGDASLASSPQPGDEIEEEYVVNYIGDGGMAAHPEAFQFVFNTFDCPLLDARFVVLSPSVETPGYVIASGETPASRTEFRDGLRAQIWEKSTTPDTIIADPAIIRVVENENGWSTPPSVERKRNLLTIHPGPRNREA
ncbi:hypothetical protein [Candidatus Korobacter versatilis]|nr:hypothetical protein [Candidatus Koribacter versatilis]